MSKESSTQSSLSSVLHASDPGPTHMDACTLVTVCGCETLSSWNWWERNQFCLIPPSSPRQAWAKLCCAVSPHHWLQWEHFRQSQISNDSPAIIKESKTCMLNTRADSVPQALFRQFSDWLTLTTHFFQKNKVVSIKAEQSHKPNFYRTHWVIFRNKCGKIKTTIPYSMFEKLFRDVTLRFSLGFLEGNHL